MQERHFLYKKTWAIQNVKRGEAEFRLDSCAPESSEQDEFLHQTGLLCYLTIIPVIVLY